MKVMIATYALVILLCVIADYVHAFAPRYQAISAKKYAYPQKNAVKGTYSPTMKAAVTFPSIGRLASKATKDMATWNKVKTKISSTTKALFITFIAFLTGAGLRFNERFKSASDAMESGWKKRGYGGSFARTVEVWTFAISYLFKYLKVKSLQKKDKELYSKKLTEIGKILTNKILELGPTFIKLGQLLSTRIDVLPREFIDQLVLLQDQVPGFSGDIAVEIIEKELGKPIDQLFDSFNRTAIAAASLGQVHVAKLNGKTVAVKIQRQGLKRLFDMDLKNIKVLAKILDKFDPKSDGAQRDWISIYDESAKLLYKEIDYQLEALNSMRFQDNFKDVPWVKVPDVYYNMTTTNVIVMEYVPGIKVNNIAAIEAAGIDRQLLAKRSAESYLTQLCRHGFFHCDPHPGNLACDAVEGGRLIYYDFGMMDELKTEVKTGLVNLVFGVYESDVKEVCDALEVMGVLKRGVDRVSVEKIVRFFLGEFANGIKPGEKWVSQLSPEQQREIQKQRRLKLGADLFSVGNDVPFKFPPTFTFVFRAFTSLDGIGKGLDPKYDLTRLAQPFLKELVDLRDGSATLSLVKSWAKQLGWRPVDISNAVQQPRKVANLESIVTKMEQGDLKLRVRVLESERSFKKMELVQNNLSNTLAASTFLNVGILVSTLANPSNHYSLISRCMLGLAAVFGVQIPLGMLKLKSLEKKFADFEK